MVFGAAKKGVPIRSSKFSSQPFASLFLVLSMTCSLFLAALQALSLLREQTATFNSYWNLDVECLILIPAFLLILLFKKKCDHVLTQIACTVSCLLSNSKSGLLCAKELLIGQLIQTKL